MDTLYVPATTTQSVNPPCLQRYLQMRTHTHSLIAPLTPEDMAVQSMPDASPVKWHLAHTTWFFETFILNQMAGYQVFDPAFGYLFNSYYEALGPRQPRAQRGLLTRPSLEAVLSYRRYVDDHMSVFLSSDLSPEVTDLLELGLAHEEQHQELLCMDVLHLLAQSPLKPAYNPRWPNVEGGQRGRFIRIDGGLVEIGADDGGFAFDNERPRHKVWLEPFEIADRLVTNGEWLEFMADGGYQRADLWLSDGWAMVQTMGWDSPLYWQADGDDWQVMSLRGVQPLQPDAPVTNISHYEAAAFAHWKGARLPTEAEWELAAMAGALEQAHDVAWQWTASAYLPYPGFAPGTGAVGEYNGKFMSGQMVLRGGASVTPKGHARPTYRNFFAPDKRWLFSGLRLARDARQKDAKFEGNEFAADVIAGLSSTPKSLSPKYFYDATGSELFEAICDLPEYYPTRTETALLQRIAPDIAAHIPAGAALIEFGSGASAKTKIMLDAAPQISAYVPIDISVEALNGATARLRADYPQLDIQPVAGDFTARVDLPDTVLNRQKIGFFPGSTIGNFSHGSAIAFLKSAREVLGASSQMIVGVDMVKDEATLHTAYDDAQGVTAAFNKNLLTRINRELDGDFDVDSFDHLAVWNPDHERIEMHLISRTDQTVRAAGQFFTFKADECFHTENSHKFTVASFTRLATAAGWTISDQWISPAPEFAVFRLLPGQATD
ncbi:ergothioneine biosynthesis protein EgtB [Asticcacaulis sp. ZE23SCel15]|uniref:ergothioneine biosynthesis protein EgtB n=1 Tax=Asticcacaulis sp. ZE23SCel15 TaxID=3059027 RepID=UPI00265E8919|nr:ergothioneine biosynthesis protein EgtB [Asticcacaulis sp. ZE23SCel15]WKL55762.1 ergothioneine biosynthesis protein EgtB [Asticcacaulis sp. ZE23SCel15]